MRRAGELAPLSVISGRRIGSVGPVAVDQLRGGLPYLSLTSVESLSNVLLLAPSVLLAGVLLRRPVHPASARNARPTISTTSVEIVMSALNAALGLLLDVVDLEVEREDPRIREQGQVIGERGRSCTDHAVEYSHGVPVQPDARSVEGSAGVIDLAAHVLGLGGAGEGRGLLPRPDGACTYVVLRMGSVIGAE